jgi:hypothetical protein
MIRDLPLGAPRALLGAQRTIFGHFAPSLVTNSYGYWLLTSEQTDSKPASLATRVLMEYLG